MRKLAVKIIVATCLIMLCVTTYAQLSTDESPVSFSLHKL